MYKLSLVFEDRNAYDELQTYYRFELPTKQAIELCDLMLANDLHDDEPEDGLWGVILDFLSIHDPEPVMTPVESAQEAHLVIKDVNGTYSTKLESYEQAQLLLIRCREIFDRNASAKPKTFGDTV